MMEDYEDSNMPEDAQAVFRWLMEQVGDARMCILNGMDLKKWRLEDGYYVCEVRIPASPEVVDDGTFVVTNNHIFPVDPVHETQHWPCWPPPEE